MRVLVTGASGFVGGHVSRALGREGYDVVGTLRSLPPGPSEIELVQYESIDDISPLLNGIDAIIHCAGVAHRFGGNPKEIEREMDEGNREWTTRIAGAVASSDVRIMIHISSIAASGWSLFEDPSGLNESNDVEPQSAYGRSKKEAEGVVDLLNSSGKLGVNLRPPLIYGPLAKGNWAKLKRLAATPFPLPFGSIGNQRSYLGIDNLISLVQRILELGPETGLGGTYQVADRDFASLAEVVAAIRSASGRPAFLLPFPPSLLSAILKGIGKSSMAESLLGDLILDTSKVRKAFDWEPPCRTLEAIADSEAIYPAPS
ncbi:MAG: NAD-dependent epimerase/dehydratase family protein [Verrucomicrobiota bacterium]